MPPPRVLKRKGPVLRSQDARLPDRSAQFKATSKPGDLTAKLTAQQLQQSEERKAATVQKIRQLEQQISLMEGSPATAAESGFNSSFHLGTSLPDVPQLPGSSSSGAGSASSFDLADAFAKLNMRLDHVATKEQIETLSAQVDEKLSSAIDPIKQNIAKLKDCVSLLESAHPNVASKDVLFDPQDVAFRQVNFSGFPQDMPLSDRLVELEKFAKKFSSHRPLDYGHIFKGPPTREF